MDADLFLSDLLELGIENFEELDEEYEIVIEPDDFTQVINSLEKKGYDLEGNLSLIPTNTLAINQNQLDKIIQLIEELEEHEDVQKVHTNIEVNE